MTRRRNTTPGEDVLASHTKSEDTTSIPPEDLHDSLEDPKHILSAFLEKVLGKSILFLDKKKTALDWCEHTSFDYHTMALKSWGDDRVYVTLSKTARDDFAQLNVVNLQTAKDKIDFYGGHTFDNSRVSEVLEKSKSGPGSRTLSIEHARVMVAHEELIPEWIKEKGHTYIFPGAVVAKKIAYVPAMRWSTIRGRLEFDVISLIEPWKETYHILII